MPNIKKITDLETYSVRYSFLREGKTIETCQFEGDNLPSTFHFGYFQENDLTGIISIFKNNNNIIGEAFDIKDVGEHYLMTKHMKDE